MPLKFNSVMFLKIIFLMSLIFFVKFVVPYDGFEPSSVVDYYSLIHVLAVSVGGKKRRLVARGLMNIFYIKLKQTIAPLC